MGKMNRLVQPYDLIVEWAGNKMKHNLPSILLALTLFMILSSACGYATVAQFKVLSLDIKPQMARTGENVTATVRVKNLGYGEEFYPATLMINGKREQSKEVKLSPMSAGEVSFTLTKDKPGLYEVSVGTGLAEFRVLKQAEFQVTTMSVNPEIIGAGEPVDIVATIKNTGELDGIYAATLLVDNKTVVVKDINVPANATDNISFSFASDEKNLYRIGFGDMTHLLLVADNASAERTIADIQNQMAAGLIAACPEWVKNSSGFLTCRIKVLRT